jgi:hypothetical protein
MISSKKAIINASYKGHLEVIKLLLNDPRVDPSAQNNRGKGLNGMI